MPGKTIFKSHSDLTVIEYCTEMNIFIKYNFKNSINLGMMFEFHKKWK